MPSKELVRLTQDYAKGGLRMIDINAFGAFHDRSTKP